LCFAYTLPTPFEYIIREKFNREKNITEIREESSSLGMNDLYKTIYSWMTSTLFVFVPLLLLAIFNSFLIRSVHISKKARCDMTQSKIHAKTVVDNNPSPSNGQQTNDIEQQQITRSNVRSVVTTSGVRLESSKQENKITVMLIAVVILFFFCQLPTAILFIISSIHQIHEGTRAFYVTRVLGNIFNFLVAINAAGNFLLYCFFSQRYRKTFVNLFCPCYRNKLGYFQSTHPNTAVYSKTSRASRATAREREREKARSKKETSEMTSLKMTSDQDHQRTPVRTPLVIKSTAVCETTALTQGYDEEDGSIDKNGDPRNRNQR